jgi:hypothetical protein
MGYYISNMIGIRLGGVFSGETDMQDVKLRIGKIISSMKDNDPPDIDDDPSHCMSHELTAHKGSYTVIAGVFNYWNYKSVSKFAAKLSEEFGTNVMVMSWDEERDEVQCNVFLAGKPIFEINENPIGNILRRVC